MASLRAAWEIRAGLILGKPMEEYTKRWLYTSDDYEIDNHTRGDIYKRKKDEAHAYAASLEEGGLNWVHIDYIWL